MFSVPASRDSAKQNLKMFGMFGKPFINDIGQGLLGNCYLLATLGSIVYKKPEIIQNMIQGEHEYKKSKSYKCTKYIKDNFD
jgi:hypothetical protein